MKKNVVLIVFILSIQSSYFAQNITKQSLDKAKEILDKTFEAYGGLQNLRAVRNFSIRAEGIEYHRNQSRRPDLVESTPRPFEFCADFENNRYRYYFEHRLIGTDPGISLEIFDGKERVVANLLKKTKTLRPAQANWKERVSFFLPQFLLLNAQERIFHLRYLGRTTLNNRPHEVIVFPSPNGTQYSLYIDAETFLITKQEWIINDTLVGDSVEEIIFSDYRAIGKFKIPTQYITKTAGVITQQYKYIDVSFDDQLKDESFKLQDEFIATQPQGPTRGSAVQKVGDNIYTTNAGSYKVLFVHFKDYIWVMEAPINDFISKDVISKIKEALPNKPIKYLALTHHHTDHSGGTRTFVSEGATLVTTKGNRSFFEQMMKSNFIISPDSLSLDPQPLKMEFVENGKRIFTDGETTVELYDIGVGSHAEEMLVAYLPKEKILYQADLFDDISGLRSQTTIQLAKWIESKKLLVETIIPVHGTVTKFADFQKDAANLPNH